MQTYRTEFQQTKTNCTTQYHSHCRKIREETSDQSLTLVSTDRPMSNGRRSECLTFLSFKCCRVLSQQSHTITSTVYTSQSIQPYNVTNHTLIVNVTNHTLIRTRCSRSPNPCKASNKQPRHEDVLNAWIHTHRNTRTKLTKRGVHSTSFNLILNTTSRLHGDWIPQTLQQGIKCFSMTNESPPRLTCVH